MNRSYRSPLVRYRYWILDTVVLEYSISLPISISILGNYNNRVDININNNNNNNNNGTFQWYFSTPTYLLKYDTTH